MAGPNSGKSSRLSPSTSTPVQHTSKLPKFLQKQGTRDSSSSSSSVVVNTPEGSMSSSKHRSPDSRRSSKLKGVKELRELQEQPDSSFELADESMDEPPVIIEPINVPSRARTRSERPLSASSSDSHPGVSYNYPTSSSSQRFSDLPTRLTGWFSHTFSSSSTDLSLPSLLSQTQLSSSPKGRAAGLLTAAKHGKGHLDKAMRYLLDSDATPDKCTDPIWLLGVKHPGYEPPPPPQSPVSSSGGGGRRSSADLKRSITSLRSSTSSRTVIPGGYATDAPSPQTARGMQYTPQPVHWPPDFFTDFTSRIWLTYRGGYAPIRDQSLSSLDMEPSGPADGQLHSPVSTPKKWWPGTGEKGWTSDTGWGCMLRTGQSLLANSLIHLHLGRDWRRPPQPVPTADYATYVKILTWFLDSPDPLCPFSVHRMALAGKELGKDVGQWFGPSTASGAIKALVNAFPHAGLGVSVASDGVIYESDVIAASFVHPYRQSRVGSPRNRHVASNWGQRAVLVLVGIRLGLDGVNPIYYDSVKALYTFPQSVGIAGGRPSSSYYFVGAQADSLFYLDPHHTRSAVPLRQPPRPHHPADSPTGSLRSNNNISNNYEYVSDREGERRRHNTQHARSPTTPSGSREANMRNASLSPTPMQKQVSSSSGYSYTSSASGTTAPTSAHDSSTPGSGRTGGDLDPLQEHYVTAYPAVELRTFHCDKVRKMPVSGLDPSMLVGFLCRDERDWKDLRARVAELSQKYKAIFAIQDEPPSWPSDSDDMGLESVSDVDVDIDDPSDEFFESAEHGSQSAGGSSMKRQSDEVETEDDPVDPITPGAGSAPGSHHGPPGPTDSTDLGNNTPVKVEVSIHGHGHGNAKTPGVLAFSKVEDEDDDWVDPALPTPMQEDVRRFERDREITREPEEDGRSKGSDSTSSVNRSTSGHANSNASSRTRVHTSSKGDNSGGKRKSSHRQKSGGGGGVAVRDHTPSQQEYYPFPVVDDREDEDEPPNMHASEPPYSHPRTSSIKRERSDGGGGGRSSMMNANGGGGGGRTTRATRARDGGRTQSGGVRGIVTSDLDDGDDF
ncbi:hypothetical protein BD410DRAFT_898326 [Rickenella mellea]|uniref:Autophagy-related protein 4 n=1 Tax=Rickenella mellea TaxID=50990 RepID=A0A4Y7Q429_9AGAM|nr:hypothetical protein BD410DRAFT_898326 [Rickenella mellea]